ncbi:MFS transporter [Paeniroseomonas aquatica]|uniref:MFS transporter n=1 Tax=Paeniroseomonas aquatica TaxID=373043 RepID=A0ABT8AC93_9PROT|nr:MFS transporter [Paeniroseomonas aquatica]MDN3567305.1 MFS transporter [Paeniroseomonas aquatica]
MTAAPGEAVPAGGVESGYAWVRLVAAVCLSTLGGVGLWSIVVALPAVQQEFGTLRAGASLPYTLTTIGFAIGGVVMGRAADRFGVMVPVIFGTVMLSAGYVATAFATSMLGFAIIYGGLIGLLGSCALFGPLVADTSLWFSRRRGIAVSLCASGNYFAGALWPPVLQHYIETVGWRQTHIGIGIVCLVTMLPLALVLRRRPPVQSATLAPLPGGRQRGTFGLSPNAFQALLMVAGVSCCVAMAMPQVHIVAYCVDLGYGAARGAEMLSLMLACGVVSRLASGWILDRIGSLATLLMGASLQAVALALFLPFDGLVSLYVVSAVFGLFQGGIVPSYAIIVRESFPPEEAGFRVGLVLSSTLIGMAIGGWMSGAIFDATGSYQAAVLNGLAWNALTMGIALWLILRARPGRKQGFGAAGGRPIWQP